mmetsp:Transcript_13210/g.20001  ORF Transcript_13210/g.20001 Transcript_13210/m.20001 type:complete len:453 (-) Transcript_13210:52-1410(-)
MRSIVYVSLVVLGAAFTCKNLDGLVVVGEGGMGTVFKTIDKGKEIAIKAVNDEKDCAKGKKEYEYARLVHNAFLTAPAINKISEDAKKFVQVPEPLAECSDKVYTLNKKGFKCYFAMEYMHGISLELWKKILPGDAFDQFDLPKFTDPTFEIQGQLTMAGGSSCFVSKGSGKITPSHPGRGFWFSEEDFDEDGALYNLNRDHGLLTLQKGDSLTFDRANRLIGYIYGLIFHKAQLNPFDVEITLGNYGTLEKPQWKINVFDFDQFDPIGDALKAGKTADVIQADMGRAGKDFDDYVYINMDMEEVKNGFETAKEVSKKRLSKPAKKETAEWEKLCTEQWGGLYSVKLKNIYSQIGREHASGCVKLLKSWGVKVYAARLNEENLMELSRYYDDYYYDANYDYFGINGQNYGYEEPQWWNGYLYADDSYKDFIRQPRLIKRARAAGGNRFYPRY